MIMNTKNKIDSFYNNYNNKALKKAEAIKQELFYNSKYRLDQDSFILL